MHDAYYRDFLRTEDIEVEGVLDALAELSKHVRMAIVTTAKRADFELIHSDRLITSFMDFVLVREDYVRAKPDPEPYLTALARSGAPKEEAVAVGIDCAVVHNDFTAAQDFAAARYRIESLAELKDVVLGSR